MGGVGLVTGRDWNVGLLEENKIYDWASFGERRLPHGYYLSNISNSDLLVSLTYPILSHIPRDRVCGKTTGLMFNVCLCVCVLKTHLAKAPAGSVGG